MDLFGVIAIISISIVTIFYGFFKYSFQYWKSRGVPYVEPCIPYGNVKGFGKVISPTHFVKNIYDKYRSSGAKFCGVYYFAQPVAILLDLALVKAVLIKDFAHFDDRGAYYNENEPLSVHLFTVDSCEWRKLRSKLSPSYTSGKLKFIFPTMIEMGERFRDHLLEMARHDNELEMTDLSARFTTDVIGTCGFGIECNSLKDPNAEFRHYGGKIFGAPRHSPMFFTLLEGFNWLGRKLSIKVLADDTSKFFLKAIRETVEYRETNNIKRNDFMDILINLKKQETTDTNKLITMNEIAGNAFVFFLAGFGSLSNTLTYCLYELALNQEVQKKAQRVIRAALEKHNGQFTYEMMMDMPYIDQLINETLRKYPSLPLLVRMTKKNYRVPGTNVTIEKGTRIIIPAQAIQNDPEYYSDPERFDPDRFSSEEKKKRDPMAWLGFGDGPRNCIALRYAMMQSRIGLVILLNSFEFALGERMQETPTTNVNTFVTMPDGGIHLKLKPISVSTKY